MNTLQKFIARLKLLSDTTKTNIALAVAILISLFTFSLWINKTKENFGRLSINEPIKPQQITIKDLTKEVKKSLATLTQNLQQSFAFLSELFKKESQETKKVFEHQQKKEKVSSPPPLLPLSD